MTIKDKRLQRKGIVYNITMLYIINIAKVVFPLITLPYLTRVLTMDCYGVVAYVKAIMAYMQLIVNFGFMYSGVKKIAEEQEDLEAIGIITGNIITAKCMLSGIGLIFLIGLSLAIEILRENVLYVILSFASVFLSTFLMEFLFRGLEQMHIITARYLIMKTISVCLTLIIVNDNSDVLWIPILDIISSLIAIVLTYIEIRKLNIKIIFCNPIKGGWRSIKISFVYFVSDIASTAFGAFNTIVIGIVMDKPEVAVFSVCMQLVSAVQALYSPIYNGIYPQMVRSKNLRIIRKVLKIFIPIVAISCIFTFFFSEQIMIIIAGNKYAVGSGLLKYLVPVLFFSFIVMLMGWPTLGAINKIRETTRTTIIAAAIQVICVGLMVGFNELTLIAIAVLRCITELIMLVMRMYYFKKFKHEFKQ